MNLKKKFCRSVYPATFTPPVTKISGSAPGFCVTCLLLNPMVKTTRGRILLQGTVGRLRDSPTDKQVGETGVG